MKIRELGTQFSTVLGFDKYAQPFTHIATRSQPTVLKEASDL